MKNKIAIASAFLAAASFSMGEIVINDFLSFEGFVDMSYTHHDSDSDSGTLHEFGSEGSDSGNSFGIDQVEIDWLFDFDPVTAQIDIAYEGTDSNDDGADGVWVEQAFATYHLANGGAITAGRFASMLGFEAFEPTGLYQYSFAYDTADLGSYSILPLYAQGVKYTYEGDNTFFGISLVDSITDRREGKLGGDDEETWGVEIAGAYYMDNGVSFFLGGAWEDNEESSFPEDDSDSWLINAYTTFETGAWLFAAEVVLGETDGEQLGTNDPEEIRNELEGLNALVMANFAYSDQASVTGRISYTKIEDGSFGDGSEEIEVFKYTLAHSYAFTDNLLLVTEVSFVDAEFDGGSDGDEDDDGEELLAAVELIFSF